MTYDEAIKYIHSVSNFFCKPGLDRIRELCRGLGDPQKDLKFIHVTGTNGKGSVCAMLDSILRAEGYKVGLFTSPYIKDFNERMRVGGENIPNDTLARLTEKAKAVADKMADPPTEFELITAITFEYFKEEQCDVVVLEVGMGGKLDATNIIDDSLLSIITGIDLDHTAFLGDTIEKIAEEKAGIFKEYSVALFGEVPPAAEAVIKEKAAQMQIPLYKPSYHMLKIASFDLDGTLLHYKMRHNIKLPLLGSYQLKNVAIVLDAISLIDDVGLFVSYEAVKEGLANVKWPARFEIIGKDPTVIFDGAHNPQGVRAAVQSIKDYFGDKKVVLLTGVLKDKDYNDIAKVLSEVSDQAFTITPTNTRALSAQEYADVLKNEGVSAIPCSDVSEALSLGISAAKENGTALCCLGSLYTYGEITKSLSGISKNNL